MMRPSETNGGGRLILALGHTFPDLSIEQKVLEAIGARVVDGKGLQPASPVWANVAGVLLGTGEHLCAAKLKAMPQCRAVVRYGIGYDNVDVAAAKELGIVVGIVRDYCIDEVAEHTIACALTLSRDLVAWDRNMRAGKWRTGIPPRMQRVSRLCFALIGFGLIGRAVARRARALFGRVAVFDPWAASAPESFAQDVEFVASLDELLSTADVLSVHVPLNHETRGLIGDIALRRLKPSAIVINASRGGIVDETALLDAIGRGALRGAALDTFVKEPLPAGHPLVNEPRVLLSPHIAWLSDESLIALRQRASEEMCLALENRPLSSPVLLESECPPISSRP
jgi:D-3-phosphoglycerate dehydrogenase